MRRVILVTPHVGRLEVNLRYARLCLKDSLARGEAPLAPHILYMGVLNDDLPHESMQIQATADLWGEGAEAVVIYDDLGMTDIMNGIAWTADLRGLKVERRSLPRMDEHFPGTNKSHLVARY